MVVGVAVAMVSAKAEIADERPKYEKSAIFSDSVQKGQLDVQ